MAKRKSNRSNAIRQHLKANPGAPAKQVIEELGKQGIKASSALVYNVKGRMTQIKVHRNRKAMRVAAASQKTGLVTLWHSF